MAKPDSKGPGWFQAYNPDKTKWYDNWPYYPGSSQPQRTGLVTDVALLGSTRAPSGIEVRNIWVPVGHTVASILEILNRPGTNVEGYTKEWGTVKQSYNVNWASWAHPRGFVEQIKDISDLKALSDECLAEVKRRELIANDVYTAEIKPKFDKFRNFMTGVIHAMACQRKLYHWKYGTPTPDLGIRTTLNLSTGVYGTAKNEPLKGNEFGVWDIANATASYCNAKVREKVADPVDKKAPWQRTAVEHLKFKLRQRDRKDAFWKWIDEKYKERGSNLDSLILVK